MVSVHKNLPPIPNYVASLFFLSVIAILISAGQNPNVQVADLEYSSAADIDGYFVGPAKALDKRTANYIPEFPKLSLPKDMAASEAAEYLSTAAPELAAWYGMTPTELKTKLKSEKYLRSDKAGRLYYSDNFPSAQGAYSNLSNSEKYLAPSHPLSETFMLHSRPGSSKTIYLDFDGHFISSSYWGSNINAPPWDIDGSPSTFGDSERTAIQAIWQKIAEDYAPFDVDVTTELASEDLLLRSSTSDNVYGGRILFSPMGGTISPGAGGVAYLNVFNQVGGQAQPAWCFPEMLANWAHYMGECGSHEIGHNLGLNHDGTSTLGYYEGHNGWAPIMGVGYYQSLTQFSKGEYPNANNKEDDFARIQTYGLTFAADDYGNTISTATPMIQSGNTVFIYGVIGQNTDIDMFRFNSNVGTVTFSVVPVPIGTSNLDSMIELRNSQGTVLASANPAGITPQLTATIPADGTYYLSIKGVGEGDLTTGYSNYASLGQYKIEGTVVQTNTTVNLPPIASAGASPSSGAAPLAVTFSSAGSRDPEGTALTYSWTLGDGSTSTQANPTKTYSNVGVYPVGLTVTDATGLSSSTVINVTVVNQPPVAIMSVTPLSGTIPMQVAVDGSASSDSDGISSYSWIFGDGTQGTGSTATHTYTQQGNYNVQLTVTDSKGASSSTSSTVSVVDPNALNAPSGLTGKASKGRIDLTWVDNSANEQGFYIERALKTTTPSYTRVGQVGPNVKNFSQTIARGQYYYRVQAFNTTTSKVSAYSNVVILRVK
ncbi:MAG TPA: PKD domain-containing protein [Acidobacteriota bacterium]|nr:PKD domain-containing protein [Acidobacteriota bacterium]